jgi:hypothetical protein
VIDLHPGRWEIVETPNNRAATAFWRRALAPYDFRDHVIEDPRWGRRPLQRLDSPAIPRSDGRR